jgi:hypothetical protein
VNDLDLRISNANDTYLPYKLTQDGNSFSAVNEDNALDNIERVDIINAAGGNYTLSISHKGKLEGVGDSPFQNYDQKFSLILSGDELTLSNSELAKNSFHQIAIYPNPLKDIISIELPKFTSDVIENVFVYEFSGKLILTKEFNQKSSAVNISLKNLNLGVYILSIETNRSKFNKVIVKD